jgi:energy-coupling factor transporter ATP-binding protein EcfA2
MVVVVFGRRGSGKSTLGKYLLELRVRDQGSIGIMVDTLLEHKDLPLVDLANVPHLLSAGYSTVVRVAVPDDAAFTRLQKSLAERDQDTLPVVLAIDEVSYWTKPNQTSPGLSALIRYGRHWRVDLLGIARRAAETSREFTSQADRFYIFATHEPRDLAYFAEIMPAEALEKLSKLTEYQYLGVTVDGTWNVNTPVR